MAASSWLLLGLAALLILTVVDGRGKAEESQSSLTSLEGKPVTQSLAGKDQHVTGIITIPACNFCPSCNPCNSGGGGGGGMSESVREAINQLRRRLNRKLKKANRAIKRLEESNKHLHDREDTEEAENKDLRKRIAAVDAHMKKIKQGPPGPRGARGREGREGRPGPPGVAGPPGALGRAGLPGRDGQPGPAGRPGTAGPAGPRGSAGPPGAAGPAGPSGAQGPRGAPGVAGLPGTEGRRGPRGAEGPPGRNGLPGLRGREGRRGTMGQRGPAGPRGPAGAFAAAGPRGAPGFPGAPGPRGQPGPPGHSGERKHGNHHKKHKHRKVKVVMLSTRTTGMSWKDCEHACHSNGMSMCTHEDLCYTKDHSKNKYAKTGDVWVPYGGLATENNWLQLGNAHPLCSTYPEVNGIRPPFGLDRATSAEKGPLYCCGGKPKTDSTVHNVGYSYGMSWQDTQNVCKANGYKLCNYLNICPQGQRGPPRFGKITDCQGSGDCWSPFGGEGGTNSWVQLGQSWPTCSRHSEISNGIYGGPDWGTERNRGAHHGPIYCCGDDKPHPGKPEKIHQMAAKSSAMSWEETRLLCKNNEMNLCTYTQVCPEGRNHAPAKGRQPGDCWTAFDDGRPDSWIAVGTGGWPVCNRHSEIANGAYGRPAWGNSRTVIGAKGPVYCCGHKPKPRKMLNAGSSAGKNWQDCAAVCASKQKTLCRISDICPKGPGSKPTMGATGGNKWIPFLDAGDNSWLQIGGASWPLCTRHSEIQGGHERPSWGLQRGTEDYHGDIYCCGPDVQEKGKEGEHHSSK